ncbi:MAG: shikimate kinase [Rhodospirillales bacterium]
MTNQDPLSATPRGTETLSGTAATPAPDTPFADRALVLVGLMGAGKSSVGRRLACRLGRTFLDADEEIERASGMTIPEYFEKYGEASFREGESRVIQRLLADGPVVLATGGGAFMNEDTRAAIRQAGLSIWLKADLETLVERTARSTNRPLLRQGDPAQVLQSLMDQRYPVYAQADITIVSGRESAETTVDQVLEALARPDMANPDIAP